MDDTDTKDDSFAGIDFDEISDDYHHSRPWIADIAAMYRHAANLPMHTGDPYEILAMRDFWGGILIDFYKDKGPTEKKIALIAYSILPDSCPYLWNADLFEAAAATQLPKHIVGQRLPFESVWFVFDRPLKLPSSNPWGGGKSYTWILLIEAGTHTNACFACGDFEAGLDVYTSSLDHGCRYPEDVSDEWKALLAAISFMNSPYIGVERRTLNRASRKRLGRGRLDVMPESDAIRFVDLRAALSVHGPEDEQRNVRWKCQWIVRCHQRAQWYPSEQCHKIIWIEPYTKGPEGAPLKTPAFRVVR